MLHELRLQNEPFHNIRRGIKKVETRLRDEKRQHIHIWDTIIFIHREYPEQKIETRVIDLFFYPTFNEMFQDLHTQYRSWYTRNELENSMTQYYSPEDEKKYGVVGIKIEYIPSYQDLTIDAYNNGTENYLQHTITQQSPELMYRHNTLLQDIPYDAKFLEIGTGSGRDADYIESLGYNVIRTDATDAFITHNQQKGKHITHYNPLFDKLEWMYDIIFANAVLLHFTHEQCEHVLRTRKNHLSPTGKISRSAQPGAGEWRKENKWIKRYFYYRSEKEIMELMEKIWYKNIDVRTDEPEPGKKWIRCIATL